METKQATSDKTSDKSKRLLDVNAVDFAFPLTDDMAGMLKQIGIEMAKARIMEAATVDAVVLPCKVGDTVFRIASGNYHSNYKPFVQPMTVTEISWKLEKNGTKDLGFAIIADGIRYKFPSIGKSVFLTREEAERIINQEVPNG